MRLSAGWRATPGFTIRCFRLFIWPVSGRGGPAVARRRQRPAFPGRGQPAPGRPDTRQRFGWLPGPTWVASAAHMTPAASASCRHVGGIVRARACPAACAAARDSQLGGAALRPGAGHLPRPSLAPPEGHDRSSSLAGELISGRCDIGASGEWISALPRWLKPGAGRPPGPRFAPRRANGHMRPGGSSAAGTQSLTDSSPSGRWPMNPN
jgi:hypothetical protein